MSLIAFIIAALLTIVCLPVGAVAWIGFLVFGFGFFAVYFGVIAVGFLVWLVLAIFGFSLIAVVGR